MKEIDLQIDVFKNAYKVSTYLRIEREGTWYDVFVSQSYPRSIENFIERFIDYCIIQRLYWKAPTNKASVNYVSPSKDQNKTVDGLMNNTERVEKLKKQTELFKAKIRRAGFSIKPWML